MLGMLGPLRYLVAQLMRALRRWLLLGMLAPQLWQPWSWSISCMFMLSRYALLIVLCLLDTLCPVFAPGAFCRCCTARHPTAAYVLSVHALLVRTSCCRVPAYLACANRLVYHAMLISPRSKQQQSFARAASQKKTALLHVHVSEVTPTYRTSSLDRPTANVVSIATKCGGWM